MAGFVATLYTINGTIILVDAENRTDKVSGIYKINEQNVAKFKRFPIESSIVF